MTLGLGPGIDYGAVGEALAMGKAIGNWQRAYDDLWQQYADAMGVISQQRKLIDDMEALQRDTQSLGEKTVATMAAQARNATAQYEPKLAAAKRQGENLLTLCEGQSKRIGTLVDENRQRRDEIRLLLAHCEGLSAMVLGLAEALRKASPGHELLGPATEGDASEEPDLRVDLLYAADYRALAAKIGCEVPNEASQDGVNAIRAKAIKDAA